MTMTLRACAVLAACAALSACGQTPVERASTGALAGGAIAAVTGESALNGALIGGAVGGIAPCVANPNASGCF
jgi:osmotically inducible lipoprotein OsmB